MQSSSGRTSLWRDGAFVLATVLIWWLAGVGGGAFLLVMTTKGWILWSVELYWFRWGLFLVGSAPGVYLSGWVAGRYLHGRMPWYVVGGIVTCITFVAVLITPEMISRNNDLLLKTVGYNSIIAGHAARIGITVAIMSIAICLERKRLNYDSRRPSWSIIAALFYVATAIPWYLAAVYWWCEVHDQSIEPSGLSALGLNGLLFGFGILCAGRFFQTERWRWLLICIAIFVVCIGHIALIELTS